MLVFGGPCLEVRVHRDCFINILRFLLYFPLITHQPLEPTSAYLDLWLCISLGHIMLNCIVSCCDVK